MRLSYFEIIISTYTDMKNTILTVTISLLSYCTLQAQESPKITQIDPQISDLFNVLEAMDVYLYRFNLKEFLNNKYNISVYIDEYEPKNSPKRIFNHNMGNNIRSLSEVPEEYREEWRKYKQIPEGKDEWEEIKEMSIYLRKQNDSTAAFTIKVPDSRTVNKKIPLHQLETENFNAYFYSPRPFDFVATKIEESIEIPLVLYASAWIDEKYKVIRFCGEKKIDPEMNAEILKHVPHYYIIGLNIQKPD